MEGTGRASDTKQIGSSKGLEGLQKNLVEPYCQFLVKGSVSRGFWTIGKDILKLSRQLDRKMD